MTSVQAECLSGECPQATLMPYAPLRKVKNQNVVSLVVLCLLHKDR
jgi:hypothetical protein